MKYCEHDYPVSYTTCPICRAERITSDIQELLRSIKSAMQEAEEMPCGGVGEDGPTQKELDKASNDGHPYDWDDTYHRAQQIWLHLNNAVKILEGK